MLESSIRRRIFIVIEFNFFESRAELSKSLIKFSYLNWNETSNTCPAEYANHRTNSSRMTKQVTRKDLC